MPGKTEKARAERPGGRGGVAGNGKPRANGKARANGKTGIADPPEAARGEARRIATELGAAVLVETSVETAQHSDDVELISGEICKQLGISGRTRQDVLAAARLHDIGKSAVRQEVLEKPGPLSDAEWEEMRRHTIVGERILASVREDRKSVV